MQQTTGSWPAARNVPVMAATTALNVGAMTLWSPILPLILRDLGATAFQVSLSVAIWTAVAALFQYQGGIWSDRWGRLPTLVYPTYLCAVAISAAAFMSSWKPFVLVYILWYVANAIQGPTFSTIIGEAVPPERQGHAFGLVEFTIGLGVVAGPLLGAYLLPVVRARGLLLTTGVIFLGTAIARHALLRETKPAAAGSIHFHFTQVFSGRLAVVLLISVAYYLVLSTTMWGPFLALHASDAMGLSKSQINLFYAAGSAVSALCSLLAGRAVARWGVYRVLSWASLALGGTVLLWSLQRHLGAILAGMLAISAAFQFSMVASDAFRVIALPETIRGRALGAIGTMSSVAAVLAVPLAGYLRQKLVLAPFILAAATAVVLFFAVQVLIARHVAPADSLADPGARAGGSVAPLPCTTTDPDRPPGDERQA
ncbi:MAG: MFS transporter [Bacillota bacterium]